MILSHVQITNYKQYVDAHDIPIPSAATIGVIGANGVGKTTLFEAIEWCLYNPSTIAAKDIRPRGRGGFTKVVVTLEVPGSGQQYLVERELKRASTQAMIYRIEPDGDESIIVQGTKQVTEHIEKKLIGLNHSAFTATFFTRQKELSFFGDLGTTARRREVGKLLGLETIREAQQDIAADRNSALNVARVLKSRYEAESQDRDFTTEIATAEKSIDGSRKELADALAAVTKAQAGLEAAEKTLTEHQALKDKDTAVAHHLLELRGELGKASERREHCEKELARLAAREEERTSLLPLAERADALGAEEERLDEQRRAAIQRRELEQHLRALNQRRTDAVSGVHSTVSRYVPPASLDGWFWENGDHEDPIQGCTRLLVAINRVDIVTAERNANELLGLRSLDRDRTEAQQKLDTYLVSRKALEDQRAQFDKAGDPAVALESASARIVELQRLDTDLAARISQLKADGAKTQTLATNLRQQQFDDICPTCQRPFTRNDAQLVLDAFETKLREIGSQRGALQNDRETRKRELVALLKEREQLEQRVADYNRICQRIEASEPYIVEQREHVEELDLQMSKTMRELERNALPSGDDISRATDLIEGWRRILSTRENIERTRVSLLTLNDESSVLEQKLSGTCEVSYDEAAHTKTRNEHQKASHAQAAVVQIDHDLARRPQIESDLTSCKDRIGAINTSSTTAEKDREEIGFDPGKLSATAQAVQESRDAASLAVELRHRVQGTLRDAEHAHEALAKDQQRISKLATDADSKQREHDQLDQMYREFTEFERFAAAWYAPRLSDITSELVSEVTEGKYDRVVFDNNFGIDIYDGDEEKFPLETFSGGERDVIALCARIALSRVIGSQGTHPPGFLVLDEVFGSLDRDRRLRLLDMLGTITNSGDHFRQIFMISHVDDVRTAPIFDELWLISETPDGSSELQSLSPGADVGEL